MVPFVRAFLLAQGRMKYVRPLFRALNQSGFSEAAREIFGAAREQYHPVCAKMVARDLGVA